MSFKDRFNTTKIFSVSLLQKHDIIQDNSGEFRVYQTPDNNRYPSITTILSISEEKKSMLKEWRERVGNNEAERVSEEASRNGNLVHDSLEQYVLGNKVDCVSLQYNGIKRVLDNHVDNIIGVEIPLYSDRIQLAGTSDLVAEYDGELSIIDYKTSRKLKKAEWVLDYFIQSCFYACCIFELYGIRIKQMVIIVAVDGEPTPQVFKKEINPYISKLIETRKYFKQQKGM